MAIKWVFTYPPIMSYDALTMPVKCFLLTLTNQSRRTLRCFSSTNSGKTCPGPFGYHNAVAFLDTVASESADDVGRRAEPSERATLAWPTKCDHCDYRFTDDDESQIDSDHLWTRGETGETTTIRDAGPGAIYDATWFHGQAEWCGPDGRSLVAVCPNGASWHIDGRAHNCDSPCLKCSRPYSVHYNNDPQQCAYEDSRPHKCWVRHGEPPMLTVDKAGLTCGAGAGSIQAGDYHGFLQNGEFT